MTQAAILLHSTGPEAQDVFQTFVFDEKEGNKKDVVADVLKKYREHCEPRKNEVYERYKFWQRDPKESETVDRRQIYAYLWVAVSTIAVKIKC